MWIASTADGETIRQDDVAGELSGWQKLIKSDHSLTQLRLQEYGVTLIGLPRARGYLYLVLAGMSPPEPTQVVRKGIGSVVGDVVVMSWVDPSRNVFSEILTLESVKDNVFLNKSI